MNWSHSGMLLSTGWLKSMYQVTVKTINMNGRMACWYTVVGSTWSLHFRGNEEGMEMASGEGE